MTDEKKMSAYRDKNIADRDLNEVIARDKAADPAPRLSEAAMARIMAEMPQAVVPETEDPIGGRSAPAWRGLGLSSITGLFRPPAWQAFALAGVAGLIAGAFMPSAMITADNVTPEEEFAIYLQSDDVFATLLEEDL